MLIFTQDRNNIINFDTVLFLTVHPTQNEIYCGFKMDAGLSIGQYETKERALDVLGEIWDRYKKGASYIMPLK